MRAWDTGRRRLPEPGSFRRAAGSATALLCMAVAGVAASSASGRTILLDPVRDATLIESAEGARANGSGPALFVGRTGQGRESRRRALIAFDVGRAIPSDAIVTEALLWLHLTPSNSTPIEIALHRVLADWGEGASSSAGGGGAPAGVGDVTWLHAFYPDWLWQMPGGDFAREPSASTPIVGPGWYAWGSSPEMRMDVQRWLQHPGSEYGWILIGGEGTSSTARRFDSRESDRLDLQPYLEVDYELPCDSAAFEPAARAICHAHCEALACEGRTPSGSPRACQTLSRRFERLAGDSPLICPGSQ